MKKSMKKFMIACAAVSSIAIAAGMSAMAADISESYDADNNSIPITVPTDAVADQQATVLVIPQSAESAVTDDAILYINQAAASELGGTALLKGDSLGDGTYLVKVGYYDAEGTFKIVDDTFTIGQAAPTTHKRIIGDADLNNRISANDATAILQHTAQTKKLEGDAFTVAARADGNTRISANDATQILKKTSQMAVDFVGTEIEIED